MPQHISGLGNMMNMPAMQYQNFNMPPINASHTSHTHQNMAP
jgi:DNA polymerase sigma